MTATSEPAASRPLDVITIGRSSVDLYGQQIGTRLEDVGSFAKSVGGCPTNIAVGTARLGLKSALITRVGAEQMGGFIKEQLARDGVETSGIVTDPSRLTALVLLSVEAEGATPDTAITLTLWPGGERRELGRADFHGRWVRWQG